MRRKVKRITALLLVMVMLAGDASLTYASEEPQATADKETLQESEQEGTGEIAEQEEQKRGRTIWQLQTAMQKLEWRMFRRPYRQKQQSLFRWRMPSAASIHILSAA